MTTTIVSEDARIVTGGVDTHKHEHVAAVIDQTGRHLDTATFPTDTNGYQQLLDWMNSRGTINRIGIEGTGSWGAGLTRHLTKHGITVIEISRPDRSNRRRQGKSDPTDALAAAMAALSERETGTPKTGTGPVEAIRIMHNARQSAVRDMTATSNQLQAVIDTAPDTIRSQYRKLSTNRMITKAAKTRPNPATSTPETATAFTIKQLALKHQWLNQQAQLLNKQIEAQLHTTAPNLIATFGVGPHTGAALLIAAGDNPHRLASSASFAALCGTSPIPASSGLTKRHRLNRAGNRQANAALWRIAMVRLSHDKRTQNYRDRRQAEGRTDPEIMRCLKRAIAREIYQTILKDFHP